LPAGYLKPAALRRCICTLQKTAAAVGQSWTLPFLASHEVASLQVLLLGSLFHLVMPLFGCPIAWGFAWGVAWINSFA